MLCLVVVYSCCVVVCYMSVELVVFFFQAEDGMRYLVRSRGLGDVYKRQLLGLTQTELASAIPFSQSLLSQVESGVKVASEEFVASVASATGTPTSFFDVDPPNVPEGTLRWRKLAGARRSDSNRLELLVQEAWRIASDLMSTAKLTPPQLLSLIHISEPTRPY